MLLVLLLQCRHDFWHVRSCLVLVCVDTPDLEQEATFPPFSAPSAGPSHHVLRKKGTRFAVALSIISGGGAFYDFNLDFGCCFGTVLPRPPIVAPPDTSSSGEILLQDPTYRTVLVNGSTAGVRFYQLNAEQDFGEAHTEIRYSTNVTMYGAKSENNYVVIWVRDSDLVTLHGEQRVVRG